ncbi:MAG: glycosyltransferase family 2 protein [Nanoarchaeota archaeon]|nr:glycosyltransferase family 2 protein [DPANN group archaeon]MBL7116646.1 glycosyltransferase family 2 protein [Nanoarchaeota archaeon]
MNEPEISIVIPAYNEDKNVFLLYKKLSEVLKRIGKPYEIIFVDDGSRDGTLESLKRIHEKDKLVKIIVFRRNFGQTAALDAGFKNAEGKIIVATDADLQNNPEDIPRLLAKMKDGYDCVSGWRYKRKDSFSKKIFSLIAGFIRKMIVDDKVHDSGCTLKAYKRECFEGLTLFGEMHRFIPLILSIRGFRIGEIKVKHHYRKFGKTKYGPLRVFRGFLDLLVVKFWMQYSARPIHLFGALGLASGFLGFIIGLYLVIIKFFFGQVIGNRPLLFLSVLLIVLGVQFIMFGFLADIMIKLYYKRDENYSIREIIK